MGKKPAWDGQDERYADTRPASAQTSTGAETNLTDDGPISDVHPAPEQPVAARKLPRSGDVIAGKYRIEQCLGRGGMGAVFSATHLISEKRVAIKWMLPSADDKSHKRFMREARAAGRIDHPNVVDVYDIGLEDDYSYLVMALLRGESLRKRLERGPLEPAECIALLMPALRGVSAVHRAGVIHRDLKPDNIFLCESAHGQLPDAKVLDFGISAISAAGAPDSKLTAIGTMLGTPAYMSPEQLRDPGSVEPRSDVYAFGVILYEALTGERPFRAESIGGLVLAIAQDEPVYPSSVRREIPRALSDIVVRALAKHPDDRWPDIDSLMTALAGVGNTAIAPQPQMLPSVPPTALPPRASRAWLVAAALLAVAVVAVSAWFLSKRENVHATPATLVRPAAAPAAISGEDPPATEQLPSGHIDEQSANAGVQTAAPTRETPKPSAPPSENTSHRSSERSAAPANVGVPTNAASTTTRGASEAAGAIPSAPAAKQGTPRDSATSAPTNDAPASSSNLGAATGAGGQAKAGARARTGDSPHDERATRTAPLAKPEAAERSGEASSSSKTPAARSGRIALDDL